MPNASTAAPRRIEQLLAEYGESHQNPVNKRIHWLAVPVIFWCVVALLCELPFPAWLRTTPRLDWAAVAAVLATLYYLRLSPPLAIGMALFSATCITIAHALQGGTWPLWQIALGVFAVAWVLQFVGHGVEGRKPSFLKDVQFLLIGPAWLMSFIFARAGIPY